MTFERIVATEGTENDMEQILFNHFIPSSVLSVNCVANE
jgi:hypothetical protein